MYILSFGIRGKTYNILYETMPHNYNVFMYRKIINCIFYKKQTAGIRVFFYEGFYRQHVVRVILTQSIYISSAAKKKQI